MSLEYFTPLFQIKVQVLDSNETSYCFHKSINLDGIVFLQFPLLRPGEAEFVYESCTSLPAPKGSVEGSFTFVPGRYIKYLSNTFFVHYPCIQ